MTGRLVGVVIAALAIAGCDRLRAGRAAAELPPIEQIRDIYRKHGVESSIEYDGNVVVIRARQSASQLQRGGSLWARVGPYIYVFNPGTREVFQTHAGVAAVRAVTFAAGGREIGRATLLAGELNEVLWRRSLNLLGHAVNEGTQRPTRLEDLVRWGEAHTEHRYDPEYVPGARNDGEAPDRT